MKKTLALVLMGLALGRVGADPAKSPVSWPSPRPLLGDHFRYNRPVAIGVPVSNHSAKVEACHINVKEEAYNFSETGEVTLDLAPGSQHIVPVISPAGNYYQMSVSIDQPNVSSKPVAIQSGQSLNETEVLAMVFAPVGTEFDYLGGYKGLSGSQDIQVCHVPTQVPLPTSFTPYLAADVIILHQLPSLNLSPQVEEALAQWTRLGGTLVLVSSQPAAEYRGTPLASLLPEPANWQPLVSTFAKRKGPLAWLRPLDQGQVILINQPVVDQKLLGNDDTRELWNLVVHNLRNNANFSRLRFEEVHRLGHPAELPKPSAAGIAWYLVVYVLLVTPLNYWWLKRRDKMLWLIVTVPVISTSIAAASFALNSMEHGSDVVLRELGLACLNNHSEMAVLDHSLMMFSPGNLRFKIDIPKDSYLRLDNNQAHELHFVNENGGGYFRDFAVPMWSLARFRSFGLRSLAGPIGIEVGPLSGHTRQLAIDNRSGLNLQHCCYHDGAQGQISQFFDVGPGVNTVTAEMVAGTDLDCMVPPDRKGMELSPEDRQLLARQKTSLLPSGLVGWTDDPHVASEVRLQESHHSYKHFPLTVVFLSTQPRPLPGPPPKVAPQPTGTPTP